MDNKRRRRCTATAKSTGKRCKRAPKPGANVCVIHGAGAGQVKRKATERLAVAEAQRMVARAGVSMQPLEHLLDSLHRAYQLVLVYGAMVSGLDDAGEAESQGLRGELRYHEAEPDSPDELTVISIDPMLGLNRHGEAQLHPFVAEYRRWSELRGKFAKLCLDARIDERTVALHQRQVELAQRAFEEMLEDLGLSGAKRQEARRAYAEHLRSAA